MVVVTVTLVVDELKIASFHQAIMAHANNSLEKESDCLQFDVSVDKTIPNRFFLYEVYLSHEAFNQHMKTNHFLKFDQLSTPWVEKKTVHVWERIRLDTIGV